MSANSQAVPAEEPRAGAVADDPASSESDGGNVSESGRKEPFANLKLDERHFEDDKRRSERRANLVMGPPLGGEHPHPHATTTAAASGDQVVPGEEIAQNEDLLADYPDDALDLELTHLRIRSLRGLGLERFTKIQVRPGKVLLLSHSRVYSNLRTTATAHLAPAKPPHVALLPSRSAPRRCRGNNRPLAHRDLDLDLRQRQA